MDKLPPVSYIRSVDIWLISVQLIPFVFVIIRTLQELYGESDIINHHGKTRDVKEFLPTEKKANDIKKGKNIKKLLVIAGKYTTITFFEVTLTFSS